MFDYVMDLINPILSAILSVLPDSPFTMLDNSPIKPFLGYVNWFLPMDYILSVFQVWLPCIGVYYIYSVAMRWIKMIE